MRSALGRRRIDPIVGFGPAAVLVTSIDQRLEGAAASIEQNSIPPEGPRDSTDYI
jgi:hypothetical protein